MSREFQAVYWISNILPQLFQALLLQKWIIRHNKDPKGTIHIQLFYCSKNKQYHQLCKYDFFAYFKNYFFSFFIHCTWNRFCKFVTWYKWSLYKCYYVKIFFHSVYFKDFSVSIHVAVVKEHITSHFKVHSSVNYEQPVQLGF